MSKFLMMSSLSREAELSLGHSIDNVLKSLVYENKSIVSKIIYLNDNLKENNLIVVFISGEKEEVEHVKNILEIELEYLKKD